MPSLLSPKHAFIALALLTYATCRGWLITRTERGGLVWANAERIYVEDDDLIIQTKR
jgi:hypothetical protein